jgi:hypothetical protein
MSHWEDLNIQNKIIEILSVIPEDVGDHPFGRPFLTAYQIAIVYDERHHEDVVTIGLPIGGAGTGEYNGLSQYFANQLSRRIRSGEIQNVEGRFLSSKRLEEMKFTRDEICASNPKSNKQLSLFRLISEYQINSDNR